MNLLFDAEQKKSIALVQEAVFMPKEWMLLLLGWINRWESVISAYAPLKIVEGHTHWIRKCRNKKTNIFFQYFSF